MGSHNWSPRCCRHSYLGHKPSRQNGHRTSFFPTLMPLDFQYAINHGPRSGNPVNSGVGFWPYFRGHPFTRTLLSSLWLQCQKSGPCSDGLYSLNCHLTSLNSWPPNLHESETRLNRLDPTLPKGGSEVRDNGRRGPYKPETQEICENSGSPDWLRSSDVSPMS